ncbi:hypothetical protein [Salmonella enterica]|uniref:hypothetical protein n=1 Tax=Salmonella enterica TaxID=28901 RepID=UPI001F05E95C|nr:hypothetical protein [Salmonella enterica]
MTDNYTLFLFTTSIIPIALIFWGCLKTQKYIINYSVCLCFYSYYYLGSFWGRKKNYCNWVIFFRFNPI